MSEGSWSLIKIDGKPLEKLLETVSSGIGVLYNPRRIRSDGKAEADRLVIMAEAESKVLLVADDTQNELAKRAAQRFAHQLMQQQANLETISDHAVKYLDETVSDEPVSDDWKARFFAKAQDVSDLELQDLWARILAKEINTPGKVSIRALEVLSTMSHEEARVFESVGGYTMGRNFLPDKKSTFAGDSDNFYNYLDFLVLQELGILSPTKSVQESMATNDEGKVRVPFLTHMLTFEGEFKSHLVEGYPFTKAGKELLEVLNIQSNQDYLKLIEERLIALGYEPE